jgi:hypothetical protein
MSSFHFGIGVEVWKTFVCVLAVVEYVSFFFEVRRSLFFEPDGGASSGGL